VAPPVLRRQACAVMVTVCAMSAHNHAGAWTRPSPTWRCLICSAASPVARPDQRVADLRHRRLRNLTAPIAWVRDDSGASGCFIACAAGFTVASILCGLAQSIAQMVASLLQCSFGSALVPPPSRSGVSDSIPPPKKGPRLAMAIWGIVVMLGPIWCRRWVAWRPNYKLARVFFSPAGRHFL